MIRVTFPKSAPAAPAFVSIYPEKYDLAASIPGLHSRSKTAARIASPPPLALAQPTSGVSAPALPASSTSAPTNHRWSVDSWFLWRRGGETQLTGGILTPSYGASQAGMVLRYRLMRDSGRRPTAYLRTTTALNGSGEREAALGISARPFAGLPLIAAGEARVTGTSDGYILRPAAILITDLPPFALPYGIRGEAYGQAGYVGGRYATPFADGQLRLDHRLWQSGRADLRFGGGIWGGAQRGASRLDAGPSLSLAIPLGRSAGVRATADWRFRVAGNAAPGSGPTLTLSAGF